jgi:integrase
VPSYRQKPGRDYAIVEWRGRRYRLPGAFESAESRNAYREFLSSRVFGAPDQQAAPAASLSSLIERYLDHAQAYYLPGSRHSEYANLRPTLLALAAHSGHLPANQFGPLALKAFQQHLVDTERHSRTFVNTEVSRVRRMIRWCVSEQLVPPEVLSGLESVQPLRGGHTVAQERARRVGVEWEVVCETLAYCSPQIADMVLVQWRTGARSDSICRMEWAQIDQTVDPWIWRPRHKTEHLGVVVEIPIGPRCRRTLERHTDHQILFRPRAARRNPLYRTFYTSSSYYQHIARAITRANDAGHEIPHWHPHQIRHARERIVEREFGIEGARAALAHASLDATRIYSARDLELAKLVATSLG